MASVCFKKKKNVIFPSREITNVLNAHKLQGFNYSSGLDGCLRVWFPRLVEEGVAVERLPDRILRVCGLTQTPVPSSEADAFYFP